MKFDRVFFLKYKSFLLPAGFIIVGILTAWISSPGTPPPAIGESAPADLSTFIPKGYLLIPIQLRNSEQLEGILGNHGFVDLYETPASGASPRLIGRRLRLVRAPLNPKVFAVLVRENEADRILSVHGTFSASLRPNDESAHEIVSMPVSPRIEIQKEEH